jgi:hypothetical protein
MPNPNFGFWILDFGLKKGAVKPFQLQKTYYLTQVATYQ